MNFGWVKTRVTRTQLNLFILTILIGVLFNVFYYIFLFVYWLASTKNSTQNELPFRSKYFTQMSSIHDKEPIKYDLQVLFLRDKTIIPHIYNRCYQINSEGYESNQWFKNANLFVLPSFNLHLYSDLAEPFIKRITDRGHCFELSKISAIKQSYIGKSCTYLYNIAYIVVKDVKNSLKWWDLYKELKQNCKE